jgi:hypothetical protein
MSDETRPTEERLAELIWRTIKLRVSLLVLTILGLLVIWSAVLSGDQKARNVDVEFCSQLVAAANSQTQKSYRNAGVVGPAPSLFTPDQNCSSQQARSFIEGQRNAIDYYSLVSGEESAQELALYRADEKKFAAYDERRADAYKLQIELSSVGTGSITVNALFVAEVAPFSALIALSVVVILGFQQSFHKTELAAIIVESKESLPRATARTQFFAMPKTRASVVILRPEKLTIWTLSVAAMLCLVGVLSAFFVNVVHLTDSIWGTYTSYLCNSGVVLAFALLATRRQYRYLSKVQAVPPSSGRRLRWLEWLSVGLAFISFTLPWTLAFGGVYALRGYKFVVNQKPLNRFGTYPIAPKLFHQMHVQVAIALLFVVVCAAHLIACSRSWWWKAPLKLLRGFLAVIVLMLSVNFILYMGILEYEAITGTTWDFLNELSLSNITGGAGLPLSFYDPAYGFILFLLSCFVLISFSVRYLRTA